MHRNTKDIIKDTFIEQYRFHGMDHVTVKSVCIGARIARSTFYAYYDSIFSLLHEIEDNIINDLFNINEKFRTVDFKAYNKEDGFPYFDETLDYIQKNLKYIDALLFRCEVRFIFKWKKIIKHHFREKLLIDQVRLKNPELVLEIIASSLIGAYTYWTHHIDSISTKELANETFPGIIYYFINMQ